MAERVGFESALKPQTKNLTEHSWQTKATEVYGEQATDFRNQFLYAGMIDPQINRCSTSISSSRSASRGSSLAPDGYNASRMLADIVEGTGYRCRHSYLLSMRIRAPLDCSRATAMGRLPHRWHSCPTHASTVSGVCFSSPVSRCVVPAVCKHHSCF